MQKTNCDVEYGGYRIYMYLARGSAMRLRRAHFLGGILMLPPCTHINYSSRSAGVLLRLFPSQALSLPKRKFNLVMGGYTEQYGMIYGMTARNESKAKGFRKSSLNNDKNWVYHIDDEIRMFLGIRYAVVEEDCET